MDMEWPLDASFFEELELALSVSLLPCAGGWGSYQGPDTSVVGSSMQQVPLLSLSLSLSPSPVSDTAGIGSCGLEVITEEGEFVDFEENREEEGKEKEGAGISVDRDTGETNTSVQTDAGGGRLLAMTAWLIGRAGRSPSSALDISLLLMEAGVPTLAMLALKLREGEDSDTLSSYSSKVEGGKENKREEQCKCLLTLGLSEDDSAAIATALSTRRKERNRYRRMCRALVSAVASNSQTTCNSTPIPAPTSAPSSDLTKTLHPPSLVLEQQCQVTTQLQALIEDFKDEITSLPQAMEVFRTLVSAIDDFMRLSQGCSAELQVALGQKNICSLVSTLISLFLKSSERLLQNAFRVVCLLSCRTLDDPAAYIYENIELFGKTDIVKVNVVSAMLKYEDSLLVTKWTTKAVRMLSCHSANRVQLGHCGVCHALLHVGTRYASTSPNEIAVLWVMDALESVCIDNVENKLSCIHHGICDFIKQVMIRFVLVESVVVQGCVLLQMVLTSSATACDEVMCNKLLHLNYCEMLSDCLVMYQKKSSQYLQNAATNSPHREKARDHKNKGDDNEEEEEEEVILDASSHMHSFQGSDVFVEVCRTLFIMLRPPSSPHVVISRLCQGRALFHALMSPLLASSLQSASGRGGRGITMTLTATVHNQLASLWCLKATLALCTCCNIPACEELLSSEVCAALSSVLSAQVGGGGPQNRIIHLPIMKCALRVIIALCAVPMDTSKLLHKINSSCLLETLVGLLCKYNNSSKVSSATSGSGSGGGRVGGDSVNNNSNGRDRFSLLLHDGKLAERLLLALRAVACLPLPPSDDCSQLKNHEEAQQLVISKTNRKMVSLGAIPGLISILSSNVRHENQSTCSSSSKVRVITHAVVALSALLDSEQGGQREGTEQGPAAISVGDCGVVVRTLRLLTQRLLTTSSDNDSSRESVMEEEEKEKEEVEGNRVMDDLYRGVAATLLCVQFVSTSANLSSSPNKLLQECFGALGVGNTIIEILTFVNSNKSNTDSGNCGSNAATNNCCREVMRQACGTIRLVCRLDLHLGLQLGEVGACREVLHLLAHCYSDDALSEEVIHTLVLLTASTHTRSLILAKEEEEEKEGEGGMDEPLALPQLFISRVTQKRTAADLLSNVAHFFQSEGDKEGPSGVFEVLMRSFGFHVVQREHIASLGCQLLGNIFQYMTLLKAEMREEEEEEEEEGRRNKEVESNEEEQPREEEQEQEIENQWPCAQTSSTCIGDTLCKTVYNLMIMAIGSHLKNAAVQRDCINAVNALLKLNDYSPSNTKLLRQLSYPDILVNALWEHKQNVLIASASMSVLIELIKEDDSVLRDKRGCLAIINALIYWIQDKDVVKFGCRLIYDIASNDTARTLLFECKAPYALLLALDTYSSHSSPTQGPSPPGSPPATSKPSHSRASYRDVDVIRHAIMATLAVAQLDKNLQAFNDLKQQTASFAFSSASPFSSSSAADRVRAAGRPSRESGGGGGLDICSIIASILLTFRSSSEVVTLVLEVILLLGGLKFGPAHSRRLSTKEAASSSQALLSASFSSSDLLDSSTLLLQMEDIPLHASFAARSRLLQVQLHVLVQDMMEFHVSDIPILTLGCECLAMMASDDVGAKAIGEDEEVCEVVCNVLRASLGKEQHLEAVVSKAIGNIARFPVNTLVLADNGVCELLLKSLQKYYTSSAAHVKEVCLSIAYLCRFNLRNKIALATSGACKLVHECFILYISNESVIPAVMFAIVALSHQNKYNLQQFSALGVTDFILELYIGSGLVSQTNEALVGLILWFIGHIPPTSVEMLSSSEVCALTVRSIHRRSDPVTVSYGCRAVIALALCPVRHNHRLLVESMHVIEILQELGEVDFRQQEAVLTNSLNALAAIVDSVPDFQDRVSVAAIIAIMEDNYPTRAVIEAALSALLSVFNGKVSTKCVESNRKTISSPVTVKIILDCVRHHITSETMAERGCQLATLLCAKFKYIHKEWLEFGVCHLIVDAFKVHKRCLSVLHEAGSTALVVCQQSTAAVSALCELGLISTLAVLLKNFATKEALVCSACEVVAAMVQQQGVKWGSLSGSGGSANSQHTQAFMVAEFSQVIVEILQMYGAAGGAGTGGGRAASSSQELCIEPSYSTGKDHGTKRILESLPSTEWGSTASSPPACSRQLASQRCHYQILEFATAIVGNLASMDASLCRELEEAGVCECVLLLLIKSSTVAQGAVLRATLLTLQQLGRHADTRQRLVDIQVLGFIDQAVSAHKASISADGDRDGDSSHDVDDDGILKLAKKTKSILMGQSFLQRNIGIPF